MSPRKNDCARHNIQTPRDWRLNTHACRQPKRPRRDLRRSFSTQYTYGKFWKGRSISKNINWEFGKRKDRMRKRIKRGSAFSFDVAKTWFVTLGSLVVLLLGRLSPVILKLIVRRKEGANVIQPRLLLFELPWKEKSSTELGDYNVFIRKNM